ncbi:hypothetical protein [Thermogemmatispora tikiterensis]|nr:hypothetical protein [Thermogemmatispora tikiterensis]
MHQECAEQNSPDELAQGHVHGPGGIALHDLKRSDDDYQTQCAAGDC